MPRRRLQPARTRAPRGLAALALGLALPALVAATASLAPRGSGAAAGALPGRIVYTRAEGQWPFNIYSSDPDGANELKLTDNDDIKFDPRWSGDGSAIAYHVPKDGAPVRILRIPASGGTPTPMVIDDGTGYDAGYPAWHPERDCIAYAGDHPARDGRSDLKVWCTGAGSRVVRVTDDRDESSSDWSPDASLLAVESQPIEGNRNDRSWWDIYVLADDGTDYRPLIAADDSSECDPRWSPDGTQIAYVSYNSRDCAGRGTLRLYDVGTGTSAELLRLVSGPPTWAPDGRSLLVTGIVDTGPEPGPGLTPPAAPPVGTQAKGIYRVDLDAGAVTRLGGAAGGAAGGGPFAWGFGPDWWGPPPTPTPSATHTATATATATVTPTATPTQSGRTAWLPIAQRGDALLPPTATPESTATVTATVTAATTAAPSATATP